MGGGIGARMSFGFGLLTTLEEPSLGLGVIPFPCQAGARLSGSWAPTPLTHPHIHLS